MPQKTNVTLDTHPELVKEWHPTNNQGKVPKDFAQFSNKKVWWKCSMGHSWESKISNRVKGSGCLYCKGKKVGYRFFFPLL